MSKYRRTGSFLVLAIGFTAVTLQADELAEFDEAVKAKIAQLEKKAKEASARAAKFDEQADRIFAAGERSRLLKESREARDEANAARQEIRFIEARQIEARFNVLANRTSTLYEKASGAPTEEERVKLAKEANAVRNEAIEMQKKLRRLMDELAPSDRMGHPAAHIWQADLILRGQQGQDGRTAPPSRAQMLQAERHFVQAAESPDADVKRSAQVGLARVFYETERKSEAIRLMNEVATSRSEYHLILAQWAVKDNDAKAIATHAKAAAAAFENRLKARVDDHSSRFNYVDCLVLLKQFDAAKAELAKAAATFQAADVKRPYTAKAASLVLAQLDARGADLPFEEKIQAINEALQIDPDNYEVFARLLAMAQAGGPQADKLREHMKSLTSIEKRAELAHLYLGYDAWMRKDGAATRLHWEKAHELTKGSPIIANNLAWNLATVEPIDLPRALTMIEDALKKTPNEPRFRSTRGQILVKLNRHRDALPDLLSATNVYPDDPGLFRTLGEVVGKLGDRKKGEELLRRADALAAAAAKKAAGSEKPKSP